MKEPARQTARSHSNALEDTEEDSAPDFYCKSMFKETGQSTWLLSPLRTMPFWLKTRGAVEEKTTKLMHHLKKNHQDMKLWQE